MIGLILGSVVAYLALGGVVGGIHYFKHDHWADYDRTPMAWIAGALWPATAVFYSLIWVSELAAKKTIRALERQEERKRLPKAKVHNP